MDPRHSARVIAQRAGFQWVRRGVAGNKPAAPAVQENATTRAVAAVKKQSQRALAVLSAAERAKLLDPATPLDKNDPSDAYRAQPVANVEYEQVDASLRHPGWNAYRARVHDFMNRRNAALERGLAFEEVRPLPPAELPAFPHPALEPVAAAAARPHEEGGTARIQVTTAASVSSIIKKDVWGPKGPQTAPQTAATTVTPRPTADLAHHPEVKKAEDEILAFMIRNIPTDALGKKDRKAMTDFLSGQGGDKVIAQVREILKKRGLKPSYDETRSLIKFHCETTLTKRYDGKRHPSWVA